MKTICNLLFLFCTLSSLFAQQTGSENYQLKQNISYIDPAEKDAYRLERCKLDLYYPVDQQEFQTLVWFHGGGLEGGEKYIPEELKGKGFAIVAVNYRLSPKATYPAYLEDAAAAVAWVFEHIESYGGDAKAVYVSGHSAGGYLTLMLGLDKKYLAKHAVDADRIKALFPISGQTNTHYTIRKERNLPMEIPIVDEYAPLNQARKDMPALWLITGDRTLEMMARYEENALLDAVLRGIGNTHTKLFELQGFNHGSVVTPACALIVDYIRSQNKSATN